MTAKAAAKKTTTRKAPAKKAARSGPDVPAGIAQVRQCIDGSSPYLGAVAVKRGANAWGVMHPQHGGHWADDNEVADWQPMVHKGS